jgi:hypothetical protein
MNSTPARIRLLLAALLLAAGGTLAGCKTDNTGQPVVQAAPPSPVTHEQAALDCWMATEHGHADMPLDKRADVVDACIKDKMAGKPLPAAVTGKPQAKSKTKPKTKPKANAKSKTNSKTQAKPTA